jgi:hydroxypyruvate isomerase
MHRFEQAAMAGFGAIEFWDYDKDGRDMRAVSDLCENLGLDIVQFTGWGGPSLADTANHSAFSDGMKQAVDIAQQLDAPMFTVVGHQVLDDFTQAQSVTNLARALERVVPILEDAGKTLILEPFNPVDHQGHFLNGSADALRICRSIDSPSVKINWDLYHMQLTEGNIVANLRAGMDQIGYVQVADIPGRHQPGSGELNYTFIFSALKDMGYTGPIGLECWPEENDEERAVADIIAAMAN